MNRHERRSSVRSIRHSDLLTHFVPAETTLVDHPRLYDAVLFWYRGQEANLHLLQALVP